MIKVQQIKALQRPIVHGKEVGQVDISQQRLRWKKVPGIPELEASTWGTVRIAETKEIKGTYKSSDGYNMVCHKSVKIKVSILVASTFLPNPDNKPIANHKNGVKDFDALFNLEWATHSENTSHAINELGYVNNFGKKSVDVIKDGETVFNARTVKEAARYVNGKSTHVSQVCKGNRSHHKGFLFKYS